MLWARRGRRVREMLLGWLRKARVAAATRSSVPSGHVAIVVGDWFRHYTVPISYLNHPMFEALFREASEKYGFTTAGPICFPCDEARFEKVLEAVSAAESRRFCREDIAKRLDNCVAEHQPLLRGR